MSERRRRSSDDGEGLPRWVWVVGAVLALLLAANLVIAFVGQTDGGEPRGFFTPELLLGVAFWVPVGVLALCALLGLWFSEQAKERREARGVGWMRGAFVFGLVGVAALGVASFENELFPRQELIVLAMWVYAVQMVLFTRLVRLQTASRSQGASGRKRRRRPDEDAANDARTSG